MRARRVLLHVPGTDWRKIEKASGLEPDCVCLDLEDGVVADRKAEARTRIVEALRTLNFGSAERLVRINAVGSGLEAEDLAQALTAHPDGIVMPKVADADAVRWASDRISAVERAQGWSPDSIGLIAMIESARGLVNLPTISAAAYRLQALMFGAEDYAADVGAIRTPAGNEVLYARSALVAYAAAFNLQAIDLLFLDFRDLEGLGAEARRGAELGYTGMQVIHPNQIEVVRKAFTPDDDAIAQARRVVEAARANRASGTGAFALDGKMVDAPIIKAAERVLARAGLE